ncbi:hypothetical protein ABZ478_21045 [Streptomyces sp. NPDC005706]
MPIREYQLRFGHTVSLDADDPTVRRGGGDLFGGGGARRYDE